jgi:hypothetical protein
MEMQRWSLSHKKDIIFVGLSIYACFFLSIYAYVQGFSSGNSKLTDEAVIAEGEKLDKIQNQYYKILENQDQILNHQTHNQGFLFWRVNEQEK